MLGKTLAEIIASPFMCNFVHDWGKWEKKEELNVHKTGPGYEGKQKVGMIYTQMRKCATCGLFEFRTTTKSWEDML